MKIVVLSCSTGGGHNACGKYITEEFNKRGITCDFVDYFSIIGKKASKMAEKIYVGSTKGNGVIFKNVYKLGEVYSKTGLTSPVYALNKTVRYKVWNFLKKHNYEMVIAPHLFPSIDITALKKEGYDIKLINVATDYTIIPFWEETKPDYFVIPHESLKDEFINKGFKEDILLPYGISVASSFKQSNNKLDLPKDKDIVLVTSGSMGFGKMEDIVLALLKEIPNVYIVAICGNNKKLYKKLLKIKNNNLIVKSFVNNMKDYMAKSKVILTKPGGLTSSEVATLHVPLVHLMPIPGVENYNAKFFQENGLSIVSNTVKDVVLNTKKLLNNLDIRKEMVKKQEEIINENSAADLVDFVINNYKL